MNNDASDNDSNRPDELSQLRRQARLNELKLKVARQNEALAGLRRAGYRDTLEGFYDPGNFFDPRDYLFEQVPLFGAIPTTRNDRDEGRDYPVFRTEQDLALIRGAARLVVNSNPTALGILTALTNYVVGNGFQYTVTARRAGAAEIAATASVLVREFLDENDWSGDLDRELFQRSRVDGEYFLALWHMGGGHVQARAVEPDQVTEPSNKLGLEEWLGRRSSVSLDRVSPRLGMDNRSSETLDLRDSWTFGVHTDHVDAQEIHGYYVQWTNRDTEWNYFPGGNAPLIPPDGPGAWLLHARLNVVRAVKRGLSDFYPVQGNLDLARRVLRNMGEGSAVQAAIAWIQETAPGTTQAQTHSGTLARADAQYSTRSASGGSRQHLVQQYDPATILKVPYGQKYLPGPLGAQNAPSFVTSAEAILRTVALRWNLPEHLVTGTAENNNFASSLVAETPFVKYAESQQQFYAQRDRKTLWQVLKFGWQAGRFGNVPWPFVQRSLEITVTPPQIEVRDPEKETRVRQMLHEAGVLSRKTWSAQEGLDFEREQRNLRQETVSDAPESAPLRAKSTANAVSAGPQSDAKSQAASGPNAVEQSSEPRESHDSLEGPWNPMRHPRGGNPRNRGWFSRMWGKGLGVLRRRYGRQLQVPAAVATGSPSGADTHARSTGAHPAIMAAPQERSKTPITLVRFPSAGGAGGTSMGTSPTNLPSSPVVNSPQAHQAETPTSNAPPGHWDERKYPLNIDENKRAQAVFDRQRRRQWEIEQARKRAILAGVPPKDVDDIIRREERGPRISAPDPERNFTAEAVDAYAERFLAAQKRRVAGGSTTTGPAPQGPQGGAAPGPGGTGQGVANTGGSGGGRPPVAQGPDPRPEDDDENDKKRLLRPEVKTKLPDRVTKRLPKGQTRTPTETEQARNFFERNREAARRWWEQRTGRKWPQNSTHDEHPRPIKDGGDPLEIEPGFEGPAKPHMESGDFQRWGKMGGRPPQPKP